MKRLTKLFAGLVSFVLTVNSSYGQIFSAKAILAPQGNEMGCDKTKQNGIFYSYPVMFDGQILDYADFTMKSKGQLTLVTGNPGAANAFVVPFYIYLRRNGKIVKEDKMDFFNKPVSSIDISDVLPFSKAGDVLIIIPAGKPDGKTKIMINPGC